MTTPIENIAQAIFNAYYLQDFDKGTFYDAAYNRIWRATHSYFDSVNNRPIYRMSHGATHAAWVGYFTSVIHEFRKKYDTSPQGQQGIGLFNQNEAILLQCIQIAGLFHDADRKNEGKDEWDGASAQACFDFLVNGTIKGQKIEGIESPLASMDATERGKLATIFFAAIAYKDIPKAFEVVLSSDQYLFSDDEKVLARYIRDLLFDSDCLGVMRCRKYFDITRLKMSIAIIENNNSTPEEKAHAKKVLINLILAARQVLAEQGELEHPVTLVEGKNIRVSEAIPAGRDPLVKGLYEFDENVFKKMENFIGGRIDLETEAHYVSLDRNGLSFKAFQQNTDRREAMLGIAAASFLIGVGIVSLTTSWTGFGMVAAISCLAIGTALLLKSLTLLKTPHLKLDQSAGLYYYNRNPKEKGLDKGKNVVPENSPRHKLSPA